MEVEKVEVYKFDELSEEVKEEVIDRYRNNGININYEWWDYLFEGFNEELGEMGIACESFGFDLYRGEISMEKPHIKDDNKLLVKGGCGKELLALKINQEDYEDWEGEYECDAGIDENGNITMEFKKLGELIDIENLEEGLSDMVRDKLQDFLKSLRDEEEYLTSDESISESIRINEYTFLKDGKDW